MSKHTEAVGLVERLRSVVEISEPLESENCVEAWNWLVKQAHEAATALASERAAHAETKRERDEALKALREARREISKTHKSAVKHENCERQHCPICEGGLFQCADCGAAEIETEQRVCTGSETRLAEALKALAVLPLEWLDDGVLTFDDQRADGLTISMSITGTTYEATMTVGDLRAARRVREGGSNG